MPDENLDISSYIGALVNNKQKVFSPYGFWTSDFTIDISENWLRANYKKFGDINKRYSQFGDTEVMRVASQEDMNRLIDDFCLCVENQLIAWIKDRMPNFTGLQNKKSRPSPSHNTKMEADGSSEYWTPDEIAVILSTFLWSTFENYRQVISALYKKQSANRSLDANERSWQPKESSSALSKQFFHLKRENNSLLVTKKMAFGERASGFLLTPFAKQALDFAYAMAFGEGQHRNHRSGGTHLRKPGEIFSNAFQGKLSEFAVYQLLSTEYDMTPPDCSIHGLGVWDAFDLRINGKTASIKSTKSFGNLLLLETKDWGSQGEYIPSDETYDILILVRIKPDIDELLSERRFLYASDITKKEISDLFSNVKFEFDIPGFITNEDLVYLIKNNYIIRKGQYLNGKTKMDASNYYCQCSDMRTLKKLT